MRAILFLALTAAMAEAQTPPTAAEIAAYDGLHAAAADDAAAIARLAAAGADPGARDGATPLMLAEARGYAEIAALLRGS